MIKIYTWKHLGIAAVLTVALCMGILSYSKWEVNRFTDSLEKVDPNTLNQHPRILNKPIEKIQKNPNLRTDTDSLEESEIVDKEELNTESEEEFNETLVDDSLNETPEGLEDQEAAFDEFLTYLDELEQNEFEALLKNLDITDLDEEGINSETEEDPEDLVSAIDQESEREEEQEEDDIEDVNPSRIIVDMIESGVASLDNLIDLMEESSSVMPEVVRDRFEPVLGTLRIMQDNGGRVVVHRPSEDPSDWMLLFINPSRSTRSTRSPIRSRGEGRVEFVPVNPRDRYIILDERNSTIID